MFDLRSDTVTRPTEAMRQAMAAAEVGDDVLGEDPTVNLLEAEAASLFGREAALFVPSGTMGNQVCLGVLTAPGTEVLAEATSHLLLNEVGSAARLWGCQIRPVAGRLGAMDPPVARSLVRIDDIHEPPTSLLSLENTHNYAGGTVLPLEHIDAMVAMSRECNLRVHMDGARIFNAQVASGVPVARIVRDVDLVSVCLSKGLGAPVGSLVIGDSEQIVRCRKLRKALGGGMRQVGVLAAAARIALEEGPALLADDHRRAQALAEMLGDLERATVDLASVQTNMVFLTTRGSADEAEAALGKQGVLCFALSPHVVRFVFHRDVDDDAVQAAADACHAVLG